MSLRVGISSSFIENAAKTGVKTIIDAVLSKNGEVPFILSTRQKGENPTTDAVLESLEKEQIPIVCVSAREHRSSVEKSWRDVYGRNVLQKLAPFFPVDMVFAFGDMTIWSKQMCETLRGVNLHPDLPGRFKGEWYSVIAQIVENKKEEAGIMIHLLTPDLDEGAVITKCSFSLRGRTFDNFWNRLPKDQKGLEELITEQKRLRENSTHPLWQEIRKQGLRRELLLIGSTLNLFAEGEIRLEGQRVFDDVGSELREGLDLSAEIEERTQVLEGRFSAGKEIRF